MIRFTAVQVRTAQHLTDKICDGQKMCVRHLREHRSEDVVVFDVFVKFPEQIYDQIAS